MFYLQPFYLKITNDKYLTQAPVKTLKTTLKSLCVPPVLHKYNARVHLTAESLHCAELFCHKITNELLLLRGAKNLEPLHIGMTAYMVVIYKTNWPFVMSQPHLFSSFMPAFYSHSFTQANIHILAWYFSHRGSLQ